jgi:uncharacterized RDD family membrane protein YckC
MAEYTGVLERVKAVVIDSVTIVLMMIAVKQTFQLFDEVPDSVRAGAFIFIFFLYDPLCTSIFGRTLGHSANGICVKRESEPSKNLNFFAALIRFIAKYFILGWISLITMSTNEKRKAIHDHLVGSVVLYKN